jgi:two-component system chemotaxis response regulator CheY
LRILVVEDDFLSRNLLSQMVSKFGAVDFAVDGLEAVEAVKASYRSKAPYSLIFLDIMMPRKDGLAALGEIREFEDSLGIPAMEVCKVIMTTALGDAKNVMSAFKSQCEAYITKPFAKKAIEEQVYKLFPELPE